MTIYPPEMSFSRVSLGYFGLRCPLDVYGMAMNLVRG